MAERQGILFDLSSPDCQAVAPAQDHSETSKAAAHKIEPRIGTLKRQVLDFLRERGSTGATDQEMQDLIPIGESTQRPRRIELENDGFVVKAGLRRQTRSGDEAEVYVAAPVLTW